MFDRGMILAQERPQDQTAGESKSPILATRGWNVSSGRREAGMKVGERPDMDHATHLSVAATNHERSLLLTLDVCFVSS